MITKLLAKSRNLKRKMEHRLRPIDWEDQESPMFSAANIHYEVAEKTRGVDVGGIGAIHLLAQHVGLPEAINGKLKLLKKHLPYWETDHVLNIAYNVMCGGRCLEDIELRGNDEVVREHRPADLRLVVVEALDETADHSKHSLEEGDRSLDARSECLRELECHARFARNFLCRPAPLLGDGHNLTWSRTLSASTS